MEISIRRVSTAIGSCGLPLSREVVVSILLSVLGHKPQNIKERNHL